MGQRVEAFSIELLDEEGWTVAYRGTVIGHKRIAVFPRRRVRSLRIRFESVRGFPTLAFAGAYQGGGWRKGDALKMDSSSTSPRP